MQKRIMPHNAFHHLKVILTFGGLSRRELAEEAFRANLWVGNCQMIDKRNTQNFVRPFYNDKRFFMLFLKASVKEFCSQSIFCVHPQIITMDILK